MAASMQKIVKCSVSRLFSTKQHMNPNDQDIDNFLDHTRYGVLCRAAVKIGRENRLFYFIKCRHFEKINKSSQTKIEFSS